MFFFFNKILLFKYFTLQNSSKHLLWMFFIKNRHDIHRNMWNNTINNNINPDIYSQHRAEDDSARHTRQINREDHLCDKSLHDDINLDIIDCWGAQKKHVHDAALGCIRINVSHRSARKCFIHLNSFYG
ncbi:hypothetical protein G9C98_001892 [Cotesia typhae]|uniref:Uncharacterized protein n=1 Tax=Cotesia typhae TaxID=2053667 RepID=A0A8J5R8Y5_9HYME|nr:hypothetical protein G9C98_001892 [Cotesia typhae]